jgi:uncharacterized protein (TIGR03083 family)
LEPLGVVTTAPLFYGLHKHLMELLRGMTLRDWSRPTLARAWNVRDVVAHLLDGDVRRLSVQRDRLPSTPPEISVTNYADLVRFLNDLNADWIRAARRMSPRVLTELLEVTGPQVAELYMEMDPHGPALFPVAWAGESQSENWLDIGREYTEKWHHQAQIRDAVGAPMLTERRWLRPVLEISMNAFRRVLKDVHAATETALVMHVAGDAGGCWTVAATTAGWSVFRGAKPHATATARCDADTAWRLFFNALSDRDARRRIKTKGDSVLLERLFSVRSVMA